MKNILIVSSYYKSIITLRSELIKKIYEKNKLHILTTFDNEDQVQIINKYFPYANVHKIDFKSKKFNIFFDLKIIYQIFILLKKFKFNCILSYNFKPTVYVGFNSLFFKNISFYTIITGLGYAFADNSFKRFILKIISIIMYFLFLQSYRKIFIQNEDDYNFFKKIIINNSRLINLNSSGIKLNINNQILPNKLSFLFASRLNFDKGISEYIDVSNKLKKEFPLVSFYIAGSIDKNSPSSIQKEMLINKIGNNIKYLGSFKNVNEINKYCSVFVLPTYREGCPNIALEFMNLQKPIIITNVPGCKKIVENGFNGFFVKKKDRETLYSKMKIFIEQPSIINNYGKNSFNILEKYHSIEKVNQAILNELY